jgi:predicted phage terminase large subunit-like protein
VLVRLRYWDLAATDEREATPASAFTSGIKLAYTRSGLLVIEDVVRGQWGPGKVEQMVEETAIADLARDLECMTYLERDPGQAGKAQAWYYANRFPELGIRSVQPQGNKLARARLPSAAAEQRLMRILRGDWNEPFLREAEDFPEGKKDQIDGLSGGYKLVVVKGMRKRKDLEAAREASVRRTPGGRHETAALRERRGPRGRGGGMGSSS